MNTAIDTAIDTAMINGAPHKVDRLGRVFIETFDNCWQRSSKPVGFVRACIAEAQGNPDKNFMSTTHFTMRSLT